MHTRKELPLAIDSLLHHCYRQVILFLLIVFNFVITIGYSIRDACLYLRQGAMLPLRTHLCIYSISSSTEVGFVLQALFQKNNALNICLLAAPWQLGGLGLVPRKIFLNQTFYKRVHCEGKFLSLLPPSVSVPA